MLKAVENQVENRFQYLFKVKSTKNKHNRMSKVEAKSRVGKDADSDLEKHDAPPSAPSSEDLSLSKRPWRMRPEKWERVVSYDYDGKGTQENPYLVDWLQNDSENPMNAPDLYNWLLVTFVSIATLAVSLTSSAYSGAIDSISEEFDEKNQVRLTLG